VLSVVKDSHARPHDLGDSDNDEKSAMIVTLQA
jgi:hypothetical protein